MLEPPESLKSFYYIINGLVKSLRLVNQQETIFIIMEKIQSHIQGKRYEKILRGKQSWKKYQDTGTPLWLT